MKDNFKDLSYSDFLSPGEEEMVATRFTDIEELHQGSYSLLAKAKRYGRWWVLKGLKVSLRESRTHLALLHKEFDILIAMQHPGIVSGVSFETVEGIGPCIVMEWIDGITLKEWLTRRSTRKERLRIALQLMDALEYIHNKQAAHRDLKPSNILITRNGQYVKLIDFGLSDTDYHAIYKQPAGTAGYISPEQQAARLTDVRNDLYSLGRVLADLQLGILYRPIVRKCQTEAAQRYKRIEELRKAFARRSHSMRYFLLALFLSLAFTGLYIIHVLQTDLHTATQKLETLADRERLVQEAIEEGKLQMNQIVAGVDTASIVTYDAHMILFADVAQQLTNLWENYPKTLLPRLTNTEAESVKQVLATHYSELVKPFLQKAEELKK